MIKVAFMGWRGLIGTTLMKRIMVENSLLKIKPYFYTSANIKKKHIYINKKKKQIQRAFHINQLFSMNIIITCQGKRYTKVIYKLLRKKGWNGYWLDSSSELRMNKESTIILDPVNRKRINKSLLEGKLDFIGGNCTVSLMLMVIYKLISNGWIKWIISTTYQAVSGAGSKKVSEMFFQMQSINKKINSIDSNTRISLYKIEKALKLAKRDANFQTKEFGTNIIYNLIPLIDKLKKNGQTKEEIKSFEETNKIMGFNKNSSIQINSQCVRIDSFRCHSQSLILKFKKNISAKSIEYTIKNSNKWIKIVPNIEKNIINKLNPSSILGSLNIYVGRIRKLHIEKNFFNIFTVGDQLLWGGAEPLKRTLKIIIDYIYCNNLTK